MFKVSLDWVSDSYSSRYDIYSIYAMKTLQFWSATLWRNLCHILWYKSIYAINLRCNILRLTKLYWACMLYGHALQQTRCMPRRHDEDTPSLRLRLRLRLRPRPKVTKGHHLAAASVGGFWCITSVCGLIGMQQHLSCCSFCCCKMGSGISFVLCTMPPGTFHDSMWATNIAGKKINIYG